MMDFIFPSNAILSGSVGLFPFKNKKQNFEKIIVKKSLHSKKKVYLCAIFRALYIYIIRERIDSRYETQWEP